MSNGRFTTLMQQVATEMLTLAGAHENALRELTAAADSALIDLVWVQRCPLLEPLRGDARFVRAEQAVQRRVAAICSTGASSGTAASSATAACAAAATCCAGAR